MRIGKAGRLGIAGGLALAAGVVAWACADPGTAPTWELAKDYYDEGGNGALLTPGNDTRVNLLLLLADRRGTSPRDPAAVQKGPPLILFPWKIMAAAAPPRIPDEPLSDEAYAEPSRCQTRESGAAAFVAAVRANALLPAGEKQRLEAVRTAYVADCSGAGKAPDSVSVSTPAGRAFAAYFAGTGQFYQGRFEEADRNFASLGSAPDPWVRETALYMTARTALNRAQQSAFDEYGSLAEPEKRDRAAIAAAEAAFEAYLKAYPNGRYASSARGLTRRVAWLSGDRAALGAAYDRQLAKAGTFDGVASDRALAEEIDITLLNPGNGTAGRDPLLVAVEDLQRMRCTGGEGASGDACGTRLTRDELDRQAPLFAKEPALLGYLRAAEAWYVRRQPREVLSLIPDAARQKSFSYLEFSRQVLRGVALDAVKDRNARGFWLSLFPGVQRPYQREALELALALHEERSGGLDRVFAADSKVRHPVIRQLLLEHVAGPELLRRQAGDSSVPKQERDVATFVLLSKDLRRGFYRAFLEDIRLMPAAPPNDSSYYRGALDYDPAWSEQLEPPPLGRFAAGANLGDAGCPALVETVRHLAAAPGAVRPRLCLAEFFRSNGYDDFGLDVPVQGRGLGTTPSQFPGGPYARLEVYKAVMADPAASDEDKALALNRAIRCYGPSHYNSCGGTEVALEVRRAWFNRLKRDYPKSRWAQSLKYYW